jgi:type IV secretory pathway VirB10-like protein
MSALGKDIPQAGQGLDLSFLAAVANEKDDRDRPQVSGAVQLSYKPPDHFQQNPGQLQIPGQVQPPPQSAGHQQQQQQQQPPGQGVPFKPIEEQRQSMLQPVDREDLGMDWLKQQQQAAAQQQQHAQQQAIQQQQMQYAQTLQQYGPPQQYQQQQQQQNQTLQSFWEKHQSTAMWLAVALLLIVIFWVWYKSKK